MTGTLTVNAGVTLAVGEGTIVKIYSGTATNGSAAEIVVNGTLQVNGVDGNPVVFAPDAASGNWGGIELPVATSIVNATSTIFTGSGEDETWFDTHAGYSTHQPQQALFLLSGSGSGTAVGAQLHLANCYCFSLERSARKRLRYRAASRRQSERGPLSGGSGCREHRVDRGHQFLQILPRTGCRSDP